MKYRVVYVLLLAFHPGLNFRANADYIHARTGVFADGGQLSDEQLFYSVSQLGAGVDAEAIADGSQRDPLLVLVHMDRGVAPLARGEAGASWVDGFSLIPTRPGLPTPDSVRVHFSATGYIGDTSHGRITAFAGSGNPNGGAPLQGLFFSVEKGSITGTRADANVDSFSAAASGLWYANYHQDSYEYVDGKYYFDFALQIDLIGSSGEAENETFASDPFYLTLADGHTPEQHGYRVVFDSGMASPDVVPEPSSLALLGIASAIFVGSYGWRRRQTLATA